MERSFIERMEAYPELKKLMEHMLDVVENVEGKADKANDAEILVVDNMRKIGAIALQEWATQRDKTATAKWVEEHPTSIKHGKKKSIGKLLLDNENS
jgi:hypothetical protein